MINRYSIAAFVAIAVVVAVYLSNFLPIFGFQLSGDPAVWGQFGDYIGGSLNPTLSFISIILLIRSVTLQNEANVDLRNQLRNSEKTEHFRSFNSLFFNLIDSQKEIFKNFKITLTVNGKPAIEEREVAAVFLIEDEVERRREQGADDLMIAGFLKDLDSKDQIFGLLRAFYISVKIVFDKLSPVCGFNDDERKAQLLTLINFTDFAQLRLILMGVQFLNYPSSEYLRNNPVFVDVLKEVKLNVDMY